MRILEFVISLEKGGRTKRIVQLCRYLGEHGHRVSVVVLHNPPDWVVQSSLHDFDWHSMVYRGGIDIGLFYRLFSYVRGEKFSLIHAHCETSMLYAGLIGRALGIPVVGTYHRSILAAYEPRWQLRFIARLLNAIVAVSSHRAELLKNNLKVSDDKLQIIHGGSDLTEFAAVSTMDKQAARKLLQLADDEIIWFSAGHLGVIKGHDDSLQAMALIHKELNVRLFIAGDGESEDHQHLTEMARQLGIAEKVILLGQVNNIPEWLVACDIFLQPSLEEAFGLVFVEAGAARRPVVATNVGGIPDIVVHEKTGLLVAPHAPVELAAALLLLSKNHELAEVMGNAAHQRVLENFTVDHMLQRYEALLTKITSN